MPQLSGFSSLSSVWASGMGRDALSLSDEKVIDGDGGRDRGLRKPRAGPGRWTRA